MWQNWKRDKAAAASGLTKEEQERVGRELGEQNVTVSDEYNIWRRSRILLTSCVGLDESSLQIHYVGTYRTWFG